MTKKSSKSSKRTTQVKQQTNRVNVQHRSQTLTELDRGETTAQTNHVNGQHRSQTLTKLDTRETTAQTNHVNGQQRLQTALFQAQGMHCASCAIVIERKLKKLEGVQDVRVNSFTGKVELVGAPTPSFADLNNAVKTNGYTLLRWKGRHGLKSRAFQKNTSQDYLEIGIILVLLLVVYVISLQAGLVPDFAVTRNMSYGIIFLIGLTASVSSCMATSGGLLVGMTSAISEQQTASPRLQKIKTSCFFNIGRILSYTLFGALIGALGSTLTISPRVGGIITIVASVVMVLMGVQLLNLFPLGRMLQPKMPQFLVHGLYDFSQKQSGVASLLVGAATFFLPCGFTQALQFYVLSQRSPVIGALTMLVFSLGTLPALVSLSGLASVFTGKPQHYVMKVAGVLVLVIGLVTFNSGLTVTGIPLPSPALLLAQLGAGSAQTASVVASIADGKQRVSMTVAGYSYTPSNITLAQGVPVEWRIDGSQASGCARTLLVPDLGLTFDVSSPQTIRFVPQQLGTFRFMCPMGMTTAGAALTVVPKSTLEPKPTVAPTQTVGPSQTVGQNPNVGQNPQKAQP